MIRADNIEYRLFLIGASLVGLGSILTILAFGLQYGVSFLAGGLLAAINLAMLRSTINYALRRSRISKVRITAGYILRLLLIPLCLYAIMRLFFFGIIAATAGFAVFSCGIFIEGVFEAFKSPK